MTEPRPPAPTDEPTLPGLELEPPATSPPLAEVPFALEAVAAPRREAQGALFP
jgi:hypothetical protein